MQKYFISTSEFKQNMITSDDVYHIGVVMRFKPGDNIIVSDGINEALATIEEIGKKYVSFKIERAIQNNNELPFFIDIYQGYPKGDKLDDIIKHSVELGVNNIYGVITKRTIFKLDKDRLQTKITRFNKIAKEAAEQSNRAKLSKFVDIKELNKIDFSGYDVKIVCYEEAAKEDEKSNFKKAIKSINKDSRVCVVIGPEGGLEESEVNDLLEKGFISCGLGPRILRCETASKYVLSAISYEWELK
ncbi:MAG: RsmE family RNA methyltransferase [Anaeroplasmataceae bacterium]